MVYMNKKLFTKWSYFFIVYKIQFALQVAVSVFQYI